MMPICLIFTLSYSLDCHRLLNLTRRPQASRSTTGRPYDNVTLVDPRSTAGSLR